MSMAKLHQMASGPENIFKTIPKMHDFRNTYLSLSKRIALLITPRIFYLSLVLAGGT